MRCFLERILRIKERTCAGDRESGRSLSASSAALTEVVDGGNTKAVGGLLGEVSDPALGRIWAGTVLPETANANRALASSSSELSLLDDDKARRCDMTVEAPTVRKHDFAKIRIVVFCF
jgi:hypothetical protein